MDPYRWVQVCEILGLVLDEELREIMNDIPER
jgi:hypothetical protein